MIRLLAAALAAILLACVPAAAADATPGGSASGDAPAADGITVLDAPLGREVRATVGGCEAALAYRPDQAGMLYRDPCKRPLGDKLALLARLVEAALGEDGERPERLAIHAGRIAQTFPDLAAELVEAAADTAIWDPELARRSSTAANAAVVQLLARTEGGGAIRAAAMPAGYHVSGIAVEKVLTALPRQLPFPLPPRVVGANSDTPLPFDAVLWIALGR